MSELRSMHKLRGSYHDECVLITSIKYTKVIKTLVVESLPDSSVISDQVSNAESNDPVVFSGSDSIESEVSNVSVSVSSKASDGLSFANKVGNSRPYSTKASVPYHKINTPPVVNRVCLFSRFPSVIRLERSTNGSFYFDGLDAVNLLHSQRLKEILDGITGKILEIDSINDKGYVNSTRLSDYPVLRDYLDSYVKPKKLEKLDDETLAGLSNQKRLNLIDSALTLREKRIMIIWFYSLFNLNMFYLILDVLDRLGIGLSSTRATELLETSVLTEEERLLIADLIVDLKTYA